MRMRVLITRPEREAAALAAALSERGHAPLSAPLFRLEILHPPPDFAATWIELAPSPSLDLTSPAELEQLEQWLDLVRALAETDGMVTSEGTIYPLLSRLRRDGLVETTWRESTAGPPRRYYRLTKAGRAALGGFIVAAGMSVFVAGMIAERRDWERQHREAHEN